jgi:hypothetical protein
VNPADIFPKPGKQDVKMGENMMIFGFGFLLGGFTAVLILGLLSLANENTEAHDSPATEKEHQEVITSNIS